MVSLDRALKMELKIIYFKVFKFKRTLKIGKNKFSIAIFEALLQ